MANVGIDYGMGRTNVDHATGIRFGVISQNEILQAWADRSQPLCGALTEEEMEYTDPCGWKYSSDGYEMVDCLDSDVMVIASPFFTYARFCSPCVPGAGNLNDAGDESHGVKTFCVGHDWFDEGKAPYPVFSVATAEAILPTVA